MKKKLKNNSYLVFKLYAIILPLYYPVIHKSFESIMSKLKPDDYSLICDYSVSFDKFQNLSV